MHFSKQILLVTAVWIVSIAEIHAQTKRYHFVQDKMGSPFHLIFYHTDSVAASRMGEQCFQLVDSLNHIFSDYDTTSELSKINRTAFSSSVTVSPMMQDLLCRSLQAAKLSKGIFDISLGRVTQVWRQARKLKQVPADTVIERASKQSGIRWVDYQCNSNQIHFGKPELLLDLGGIAKGFVAQQVVDRLKSWGVLYALADAGGDMAATEAPPGKKGWQIAINRPEEKEALLENLLLIKNKAVATSGDSFQVLEADNLRYSHIIDPHSGKGITNGKNVTVIAADGATADWLATACSILDTDAALALAKKCGAELLITQLISGQIVYAQTPGFWK
jgi:thiamine biosynthesis lipoprotein